VHRAVQLSGGAIARAVARWHALLRQERAAIAGVFAIMAMPLVSGVALAVDYALFVDARIALQNAVDEAALAGASAYSQSTQATAAQTVATNALKAARLPGTLTAGTPAVTTNSSGTINPNLGTQAAYTVTVTDTAQVTAGFIRIFRPSVGITVSGTAANPKIAPNITFSNVRSSACDGNTLYLYQVPMGSDGKPNYASVPSFTTGSGGNYYEIGNNFGGTLPSGQTLPTVTATQPLGIMLANKKNGNGTGCGLSSADSYGAPNGFTQYAYSSLIAAGESPSQLAAAQTFILTTTTTSSGWGFFKTTTTTYAANYGSGNVTEADPGNPSCNAGTSQTSGNTTTLTQTCTPNSPTTAATYSATPSGGSIGSTPNCSLYIQTGVSTSYVSGLSSSSTPPNAVASGHQGSCYSPTDDTSGYQYAAATCLQLSGLSAHTAVFWWNDTGGERAWAPGAPSSPQYGWTTKTAHGSGDDRDYNDAFFALTCSSGNSGSGTGLTAVVLTQ
jgi:Flp pilus assembly protein TadG